MHRFCSLTLTTTIEFTNPTGRESVSQLFTNTMWISEKTAYMHRFGYPWPSRTPCGCCCPDSENTAYMHRFCSLTLTTTIEFTTPTVSSVQFSQSVSCSKHSFQFSWVVQNSAKHHVDTRGLCFTTYSGRQSHPIPRVNMPHSHAICLF